MKFPVLCFFGVFVAAPALAQMAPFSVHTSATMLEHRSSFQMVQLEEDAAGGPALMALGGHDGTAVTATTEMGLENWDDVGPDVWEEASPMLEARMDFTAHAMLGNVWVFGGFDGTYTLDATERFDVTTGAWSQGPAMSVPRTNHRSARMNDGRILITGGFDGQGETASCEVFDPVGMTFTSVAPMNVGRASHTLTPVGDGRFVVTGGFNAAEGFQLASCEVYDPATDTWTDIEPLPTAVDNHAASLITLYTQAPNTIMLTGGRVYNAALNLFEGVASGALLDLGTMTWAPFDLTSPHSYHLSCHLDPNAPEVFILGGADQTGVGVTTTFGTTEWTLGNEASAWPDVSVQTQNRVRAAGSRSGTSNVACYTVCGGDEALEGTCFTVCPETSSITELSSKSPEVGVHPNPAVGRTVVWSVDGAHERGWTLLSVGGHVVRQGRGSALDVMGLPAGPYLLNLPDGRAAHVMVR